MMENEPMPAEEKKRGLCPRRKERPDMSLEHGAVSLAQHDRSLGDLTVKIFDSDQIVRVRL